MKIKDTYNTVDKNEEGSFKDKGSKFIAYIFPVRSEKEVKYYVQKLKKEHYSARHHCYAYRIGNEGEQYRANDDGEPSGTAGRPILGQLLSHDVTNILVVVVRYFGGTLLGVSGLINAYKNATLNVLNNSNIIEKIVEAKYLLEFEYSIQKNVMRVIKEYNLEIKKAEYNLNCKLEICIRLTIEQEVKSKLLKIEGLKTHEIL